ncbi:MAG: hypothetical protein CL931_16385 [Deltaproteobacteria bacterium]|nr:hypothetical protein [Deltaproteobacteria bacterium]
MRSPGSRGLRGSRRLVGAESLLLPGEGVVLVTNDSVRLDLDGLSKEVVLDRLARDLRTTFPNSGALLSFGESCVFEIGDPDCRPRGGGWRLEVRSRDERGTRLSTIQLCDLALSVSSSLGRTSEIGDTRISHVVDPRTAIAVEGTVEAVVVSSRAGLVDGWSTALLVLGAQREAMRLVDRVGLEAYVFEEAGPGSRRPRVGRPSRPRGARRLRSSPVPGSCPTEPTSRYSAGPSASAQSRRASSVHVQARPVPPQEPLSSRFEKITPTAIAAKARQKKTRVARRICIGVLVGRMSNARA